MDDTYGVLMANNEGHLADSGGMVSPSGISYIGASAGELGRAACVAVKRINLDKRMVEAADRAGADFRDGLEVVDAALADDGMWTVEVRPAADGGGGAAVKVHARELVIADGSASRLATKLGMCNAPPLGVCSRAFVQGGTHNCNYDGVCFFQRESLPGYSAIFRHPNDEVCPPRTARARPRRSAFRALTASPRRARPTTARSSTTATTSSRRATRPAPAATSAPRTSRGSTTTPSRRTPSSPPASARTPRSSA